MKVKYEIDRGSLIKSVICFSVTVGILICAIIFNSDRLFGLYIGIVFPPIFGITKWSWNYPIKRIKEP